MAHRKKETARFRADAANGQQFVIVELTEMIDITTLGATTRTEMAGAVQYQTASGDPVNQLSPTEYQIVRNGLKVKRQP